MLVLGRGLGGLGRRRSVDRLGQGGGRHFSGDSVGAEGGRGGFALEEVPCLLGCGGGE